METIVTLIECDYQYIFEDGSDILYLYCKYYSDNITIDKIEYLINLGCNKYYIDEDYDTLLHLVCDSSKVISYLFENYEYSLEFRSKKNKYNFTYIDQKNYNNDNILIMIILMIVHLIIVMMEIVIHMVLHIQKHKDHVIMNILGGFIINLYFKCFTI